VIKEVTNKTRPTTSRINPRIISINYSISSASANTTNITTTNTNTGQFCIQRYFIFIFYYIIPTYETFIKIATFI